MHRLWFITNTGSGTATAEKCAAIEAVFDESRLELVGRTRFPEEDLPDAAALETAQVDTLVLFAGDGTVNAALTMLSEWGGDVLVLPGGTMNLLSRELHDTLDPHEIVRAAHRAQRRIALPYIESGDHRAFVGLIVGPAAHWARAREAVRKGRLRRLVQAARSAWVRSFSGGVRLSGGPGLMHRHQAVIVTPTPAGLDIAAVDARDWGALLELGWNWITGDWIAARAVETQCCQSLAVVAPGTVLALFDGEPVQLSAGAQITRAFSRDIFLSTKASA